MGLNYYYKSEICSKCYRSDQIHIGKHSMGWSFLFHGNDDIRSFENWLELFREEDSVIVDEYENIISVEEFVQMVESYKSDKSQVSSNPNSVIFSEWMDEEDHSFCSGTFC